MANMTFRKTVFWLHLVCGVVAGIIVLIMSVTGVALTYQKQITSWADKKSFKMQVPANGTTLSPEALLQEVQKARPEMRSASVTLSSDPEMPTSISTGPNGIIFVNPYTAEILGAQAKGVRTFFRIMTDWHRWLALSGPSRGLGRAVTGACNLTYLLLAVTGLYLWWPRKWGRGIFRTLSWFRFGLSGKARDSNWHYVFGFWCVVPLILVVLSGVVISYGWASNLVFQLAGSNPPVRMERGGRPGGPSSGNRSPGAPVDLHGLDTLLTSVQQNAGEWKTISFQLPSASDKTASFSVDKSSGGQPQLRSTITLDRKSGQVIRSEGFENMDRGQKARIWMRFVHTGEYYGIPGQTIAGIASAAGAILVWTGLALTFRRYFKWMRQRAEA
jgi:uncharacterized iron-regulated membrane protein